MYVWLFFEFPCLLNHTEITDNPVGKILQAKMSVYHLCSQLNGHQGTNTVLEKYYALLLLQQIQILIFPHFAYQCR